jgi:hypothetical protein
MLNDCFKCNEWGKKERITEPFFTKFKIKCERIHTFIDSLNPKSYKDVCKRKEFNVNGSLTNIILCNLENEILLNAVQYLMGKDFKVDVLVFGGCMIRKEKDKEINSFLYSLFVLLSFLCSAGDVLLRVEMAVETSSGAYLVMTRMMITVTACHTVITRCELSDCYHRTRIRDSSWVPGLSVAGRVPDPIRSCRGSVPAGPRQPGNVPK